jgi:hypothetical protein
MSILAALLGAAGGGAAWVLLHLIGLLTNLALFHRYSWDLPSFKTLAASPWIVVAAVAGAFVVSLLAKWAPVIRGARHPGDHGSPAAGSPASAPARTSCGPAAANSRASAGRQDGGRWRGRRRSRRYATAARRSRIAG